MGDERFAERGESLQDGAAAETLEGELDDEVRVGHVGRRLFCPFGRGHEARTEEVAKARILELLGLLKAVEVEVIEREARDGIGLDEREGGALHGAGKAEAAQHGANERRLACTEVALKAHGQTVPGNRARFLRDGVGKTGAELVGVVGMGKRRFKSKGCHVGPSEPWSQNFNFSP